MASEEQALMGKMDDPTVDPLDVADVDLATIRREEDIDE